MPGHDLPTVLLMETLRVGASILMVAGVALVAGAVLTETTTDTSKIQNDPYAGSLSRSHARALSLSSTHFLSPTLSLPPCLCHSRTARTHSLTQTLTFVHLNYKHSFGFAGAVGLGSGAVLASIPMWITYQAILVWQRAIAPRDLRYPPPISATAGVVASIRPTIGNEGMPPAQFVVDVGQLPAGMRIDRRTGVISGAPQLKEADLAAGEARFRVTVTARNIKGTCRTTLVMLVTLPGSVPAGAGAAVQQPPTSHEMPPAGAEVLLGQGGAGAPAPAGLRLPGEGHRGKGLPEGEERAGGRHVGRADGDLLGRLDRRDAGAGTREQADGLAGEPRTLLTEDSIPLDVLNQAQGDAVGSSGPALTDHQSALNASGEGGQGGQGGHGGQGDAGTMAARQVDV
jgi:hypothetical protein